MLNSEVFCLEAETWNSSIAFGCFSITMRILTTGQLIHSWSAVLEILFFSEIFRNHSQIG